MHPLLLLLLLHIFSALFVSSSSTPIQSFTQCFANRTNSPDLISLPDTASYSSALHSSVKNQRFLFSQNTSKPALIISAATEAHVQATVSCALAANLRIRALSGGHDYEGMSYSAPISAAPFITLDISALRSVSFDEALTTAWVQAGATVGELYYAIGKKSATRAFPAGVCPTIGVGGHFSGGGMGPLTRKFGLSSDNVIDARIVDAGGRLLDRQAMGEDLFWAIRGAGSAGFGIIVAFKIRLVAIPPVITTFNVAKKLSQNATGLVARWEEVAHQFDVNLFIRVIARVSKEADGTGTIQVIFNSIFLGRQEELLAVAGKSFPELGLTAADCTEVSWLESTLWLNGDVGKPAETLLNRNPVPNLSFKAKSDFVTTPIRESGLEKIWRLMIEARSEEETVLILEPLGGMMSEIGEEAAAFPHRKGNIYNIQYYIGWVGEEEEEIQRHLEWTEKLYAFMAPYASNNPRAAYYNYKDVSLGSNGEVEETSYSAAREWGEKYFKGNFERLAVVKAKVDPGNFFWNEQSVPPLKTDSV